MQNQPTSKRQFTEVRKLRLTRAGLLALWLGTVFGYIWQDLLR
jgi:hypothetical protein